MSEFVPPASPTPAKESSSSDPIEVVATSSQLAQSVEISRPHPFVIVEEHFSVSPPPIAQPSDQPTGPHTTNGRGEELPLSPHSPSPSNAPSESSFSSVEPVVPSHSYPEMSSSSAFSFLSNHPADATQSQPASPAVASSVPGSTASSVISPEEEQWMLANASLVVDENGNGVTTAPANHEASQKSGSRRLPAVAEDPSSFSADATGSFLRWVGLTSIVVAGLAVLWTVVFG